MSTFARSRTSGAGGRRRPRGYAREPPTAVAGCLAIAAERAPRRLFADRARRRRAADRIRLIVPRRPRDLRRLRGAARRFRVALCRRHCRHRRACDARVPGRRHLPGAGVSRLREAVFPARLGVVGGVSRRHRRDVLRQGRRPVLARLARQASMSRASSRCIAFRRVLFLLVRRWTQQGRLDRRTVVVGADESGEALIEALDGAARLRRAHHRRVRRPRRRPRAAADAAGGPSSARSTISSNSPAAPASTWSSSRCRSRPRAASCRCSRSCGCCRSTSGSSAHSNKLRFRPRSYSYIGNVPVLDVFDRPITDWDVVMKWLFDKIVGGLLLLAAVAGDGAGRARDQARQPRSGVLPAEALRLQQRADRGLQVPLDVCRADRRDRIEARDQGRPARHPRRPLHPQGQPRRVAAALQRGVQGQPVAGRPAPARGARQGRRTGSTTKRSTAISPATASSPASPAGRRSTAGAAKPTPRRRSSAASSTTSTTSRTGRCCSTSTSWRDAVRAAKTENAY